MWVLRRTGLALHTNASAAHPLPHLNTSPRLPSPSFSHSYYTSSSTQSWHCAAPHGPFAFCLSLTKWDERHFSGGETMLLQPNVLATDEVRCGNSLTLV